MCPLKKVSQYKPYPLSQSKMCPLQLLSANKTCPLGGNKMAPLIPERTRQRIQKQKKPTERMKLSGRTPENKSQKTCPQERQQIGLPGQRFLRSQKQQHRYSSRIVRWQRGLRDGSTGR